MGDADILRRVPRLSTQHATASTRHPKFRFIVFDLDGTLVDSRRDIADAANALLVSCGAPPLPETRIGRMVGDGAATLVARAFEASGLARPADALERFLAIYDDHLTDHTRPYPGMVDVLAALSSQDATLAVLTNKPLAATRTILDRLRLSAYFRADLVLGGDGPLPRKPDSAGLRHLIELVHANADETLLVGDSVIDWRTAHAAGTAICLARYGFGFEGFPIESLVPSDLLIDAPADLLRLSGFSTAP